MVFLLMSVMLIFFFLADARHQAGDNNQRTW